MDCTALLRLRDRLGHPFVLTLRLVVLSLRRHPMLNASWEESEDGPRIRMHRGIRLGSPWPPNGSVVPVIDDAQVRTTRELATSSTTSSLGPGRARWHRRNWATRPSRCPTSVPWDWTRAYRHQLPRGRHPGMGSLKPRSGGGRRRRGGPPHHDADLRFRPPDRRRRAGWPPSHRLRGLIESPETAPLDL